MAIGKHGSAQKQLGTLWNMGAIRELTDGQLLERFAGGAGDVGEMAFGALVERHGPMVLRVCRGVLADPNDAQDAFQATFLVLVKKSRGLWVRDSIGPWLHQVAFRSASRVRSDAVRRRRKERRAAETSLVCSNGAKAVGGDDEELVLHEEIDRLPERYRVPLVLCDLQGRTHEQTARHLGWPVGTVKSRLTRARDRLRGRLTRRGLAPSAVTPAPNPADAARAAIPPALATSTIRAAIKVASGHATAGVVSASVEALCEGVAATMTMIKYRFAFAVALFLGAGSGVLAYQAANSPGDKPAGKTSTTSAVSKRTPALPDLEVKTKAIKDWLDKRVVLNLPNDTTLEVALKAVKKATAGPDYPGVPIYVNPAGLQEAKATMEKPIFVGLPDEPTPLSETLRLLLRPLGLDYYVDQGLLLISSRDKVVDEKIVLLNRDLQKVIERLREMEARERLRAKGERPR